MAYANANGAMAIATGNKSELGRVTVPCMAIWQVDTLLW